MKTQAILNTSLQYSLYFVLIKKMQLKVFPEITRL
ncbi:hypothetical protein BROSI_A3575 [Candidatus Brocadia sinica JPN1]|uniref:Uncharacterized protein n=1 Tax=Candidatus Brocadia sinica JPN1 TaxID=1197129 RepID=A0ABQ0K1R0_9BACT|nr:hypothetical protein BROSI_A3575 [Candidatus Brocadia sinica JPN1]